MNEKIKQILKWSSLTLSASNLTIINNESGFIDKQTLTALLGPSGAGKTSLLNALSGRVSDNVTIKGQILYNNKERIKDEWTSKIAYIEQFFYAYMHQTIYETFNFSANIRKYNASFSEIQTNINEVLNVLGLEPIKNTYLNNLSGGELKRVSVGVELFGDPELIFLDEPTSGLDSFNALKLVRFLKELTKKGKTILLTIHQPSYKIIKYFNEIKIMSQGNTIVQMDIDNCIKYFLSKGFRLPENTNPLDYFLDLVSVDTENEQTITESHNRITYLISEWKKEGCNHVTNQDTNKIYKKRLLQVNFKKTLNLFFNFSLLLKRNIIELYRDEKYLYVQIGQKVTFTLLLGLAYLQLGFSEQSVLSRRGIIFFILINNLFSSAGPIFNVFPIEKKIIYRERKSGMYSGITAYISKFISLLVFNLFFSTIYLVSVYWMVGLHPNAGRFFIYILIQLSIIIFSVTFGLTVGTISPTENFAQVFGTTLLITYIIFGGGFSNPSTIPSWLRWIIWISPVNYAYRASMLNQFTDLNFGERTGMDVLEENGIVSPPLWNNIFGLWGFTLAYIFFGAICLHYFTNLSIKLKST